MANKIKLAHIQGGYIRNISVCYDDRIPANGDGWTYMEATAAREAGIQFAPPVEDLAVAARLAKRPKRSQINGVLAGIEAATTIAALRTETLKLAAMMRNVLELQNVEVEEDL